jgi:DNA-binding winged helix-turn-helix (wHTH) protein
VVYRFGDFTLDCDTRQLFQDRSPVHLSPKAFELLTLLIANRARAVSKIELQEKVWPATFVQETSVAGLVNEIRRALNDPPGAAQFVGTVHRFGYRFVGSVTEIADSGGPESARAKFYLTVGRRQVMLMEGAHLVGRTPDAAIAIDSPSVSRSHARLCVSTSGATIEDLGSKNGTHVNGERISQPVALHDGQEIKIGGVVVTFHVAAPTNATETIQ